MKSISDMVATRSLLAGDGGAGGRGEDSCSSSLGIMDGGASKAGGSSIVQSSSV